jgi:hypothetical protein
MLHPGLKDRGGRGIPMHPTVPVVERARSTDKIQHRPGSPVTPGVPGPISRMAAMSATHLSKQGIGINSMLMPFYTLGVVAFFGYTVVKVI